MQRLRDADWQAAYLAASGTAHVPWEPVLSSYAQLAEAADVLGRADLAAALQVRVTPQLCRAYAPALAVLRRLARDPLAQAPVEFARADTPPTAAEVWADAMQGVRDELRPAELSSLSDGSSAEDDETSSSSAASSAASSSSSEDAANAAALGLDLRRAKVPALAPRSLSHAELVRELRLCLLGLRTLRRSSGVAGVSAACGASVWARFEQHARALAALPAAQRAEARAEITRWRCATLVQLVCCAERLVARYARLAPSIDTSGVSMFLSGDAQSPAVVRDGHGFAFAPALPAALRHAALLRGGEAAVLAARIHGAPPPRAAVVYASPQQYAADLYRLEARNAALLMTPGLKARLAACWRALAGVYLAQDARVLLFLQAVHEEAAHEEPAHEEPVLRSAAQAQRVLDRVWPAAPFGLDAAGVPVYARELDARLEAVLGARLERVFGGAALAQAWAQVVRGFRAGDQRVELAMAERAAAVDARIRSAAALQPFI